jgi:protein-disulfide isomerase
MKSFIWIGGITIVLIALMLWGVGISSGTNPAFELGAVSPMDNVKGNASSTVVIVEYSDFQCPACRTYYPILREITTEFGDRVAFVYRYFPLSSIHANAAPAAWAAQAAANQGKFWEMHDLLFEKQSEWENEANVLPLFESYASLLGISVDQFKADFSSKQVRDFVKAQELSALKFGLAGTPSFFINGVQIQNPTSTESFRAIINGALQSKK